MEPFVIRARSNDNMTMPFIVLIVTVSLLLPGCVAQNAADIQAARMAQRKAQAKTAPPPVVYKPPVYEPTVYERKATFQPEDYVPYQAKGTATLSGEAFLKTRGGEVRYAVGERILLIPATAYGKEFLDADLIRQEEDIRPALDKRIYLAIRSAQADSVGRFSFLDLPEGNYLLYASIYWEVPKYSPGIGSYSASTGGRIWQPVLVRNGEQKTVVLTR